MKKRFVTVPAAILALSLSAVPTFAAGASPEAPLTRGQFFSQVAEHLKLAPADESIALPADVSADSPYAAPIRALIERHILDGYPDGTFRPDQPITKQEAGYVLARFLGFADGDALDRLQAKFGVSLGDSALVPSAAARQAIQASLANDAKVVEWLEQSYAKQAELKSFRFSMDQSMAIRLKGGLPVPGSVAASVYSEAAFDLEKGMHMTTSMKMPSIPDAPQTMEMEQFFVPEGVFMKMPDPTGSGAAKWYNASKLMPYTFEQLIDLQKNGASMNAALLNKLFFYRDLGVKEVDGASKRTIEVNGKIHDFESIMKALGSVVQDKNLLGTLPDAADLARMSLSMNGTMVFDESTKLIDRMDLSLSIGYPATDTMPLEGMDMEIAAEYKAYNEQVDIKLPDEAKNAPELPGIGGGALPELPATPEGETPNGDKPAN